MLIPVICDNNACGTVWFSKSIIGGDGTALMKGNKSGPCPRCGGFGDIPDGVYSPIETKYFDSSQEKKVAAALNMLRELVNNGATIDQIQEQIKTQPVLEYLRRFEPKDLKELRELLTILGIIIGGFWIAAQTVSGTLIGVPKDAYHIVVGIIDSLQKGRPGTPYSGQNEDKPNSQEHKKLPESNSSEPPCAGN